MQEKSLMQDKEALHNQDKVITTVMIKVKSCSCLRCIKKVFFPALCFNQSAHEHMKASTNQRQSDSEEIH